MAADFQNVYRCNVYLCSPVVLADILEPNCNPVSENELSFVIGSCTSIMRGEEQNREEEEIWGKSREEGEKKLNFREEGEIGSKRRENGDLPPCSTPLHDWGFQRASA